MITHDRKRLPGLSCERDVVSDILERELSEKREEQSKTTFYVAPISLCIWVKNVAPFDISRMIAIAIASRARRTFQSRSSQTYPFSSASKYRRAKESPAETRAPQSSPENPPCGRHARCRSCCCQISQKTILKARKEREMSMQRVTVSLQLYNLPVRFQPVRGKY